MLRNLFARFAVALILADRGVLPLWVVSRMVMWFIPEMDPFDAGDVPPHRPSLPPVVPPRTPHYHAQRIQAVDYVWVESGEQQEIVLEDGRTVTVTSGGVTVIPLRFGYLPKHNPGDIIEHVNALMPPTGVNPRWN